MSCNPLQALLLNQLTIGTLTTQQSLLASLCVACNQCQSNGTLSEQQDLGEWVYFFLEAFTCG